MARSEINMQHFQGIPKNWHIKTSPSNERILFENCLACIGRAVLGKAGGASFRASFRARFLAAPPFPPTTFPILLKRLLVRSRFAPVFTLSWKTHASIVRIRKICDFFISGYFLTIQVMSRLVGKLALLNWVQKPDNQVEFVKSCRPRHEDYKLNEWKISGLVKLVYPK